MIDDLVIGEKFRALAGELDERQRRLWASEAMAAGRGGIAAAARATGMSAETVRKGIAELGSGERLELGRVHRPGGSRKRLTEIDPSLALDGEERIAPTTRRTTHRSARRAEIRHYLRRRLTSATFGLSV